MKTAIISYNKLRHAIGLLGLALPSFLYIHNYIFGHCYCLQDSISHYYYTTANVWFIGILWGLGLMLIFYPSYSGESKRDGILTNISGICAICVSLFPTNSNSSDSCAIFEYCDSSWRAGFHYFCASSMLLIFSFMSICIFTQTYEGNDLKLDINKQKRIRNYIYITCGIITLLSVSSIGIIALIEYLLKKEIISPKHTFWLEICALVPFGISWLIKGGFALTDNNEVSTIEKIKKVISKK